MSLTFDCGWRPVGGASQAILIEFRPEFDLRECFINISVKRVLLAGPEPLTDTLSSHHL